MGAWVPPTPFGFLGERTPVPCVRLPAFIARNKLRVDHDMSLGVLGGLKTGLLGVDGRGPWCPAPCSCRARRRAWWRARCARRRRFARKRALLRSRGGGVHAAAAVVDFSTGVSAPCDGVASAGAVVACASGLNAAVVDGDFGTGALAPCAVVASTGAVAGRTGGVSAAVNDDDFGTGVLTPRVVVTSTSAVAARTVSVACMDDDFGPGVLATRVLVANTCDVKTDPVAVVERAGPATPGADGSTTTVNRRFVVPRLESMVVTVINTKIRTAPPSVQAAFFNAARDALLRQCQPPTEAAYVDLPPLPCIVDNPCCNVDVDGDVDVVGCITAPARRAPRPRAVSLVAGSRRPVVRSLTTCDRSDGEELFIDAAAARSHVIESALDEPPPAYVFCMLVEGRLAKCLWDPGAGHSLMSEDFATSASIRVVHRNSMVSCHLADGSTSRVPDVRTLALSTALPSAPSLGVPHRFRVLPSLIDNLDIVCGRGFAVQHDFDVRWCDRVMIARAPSPWLGHEVDLSAQMRGTRACSVDVISAKRAQKLTRQQGAQLCAAFVRIASDGAVVMSLPGGDDVRVDAAAHATASDSAGSDRGGAPPARVVTVQTSDPRAARLLDDFADVLSPPSSAPPLRGGEFDMRIPLLPGSSPPSARMYRLSVPERDELARQLASLIAKGFIVPSESAYGASVFFVTKPGGSGGATTKLRLVVDYRKLNQISVPHGSIVPCVGELLDRMASAKVFTSLDLAQGYHQLRVAEEDQHKTAMVTPLGRYEWRVVSLGLTNAPSVFIKLMNHVMDKHGLREFCVNFLDDFVCFSPNLDTHLDVHLPALLTALRLHHLHCNPAKVFICADSVAFLGYQISPGFITPLQSKLDAVAAWPEPTCTSNLRAFLGLCNFYRAHVRDHAFLQAPLDELTGARVPWRWEQHHRAAFLALRTAVSSAPCVAMVRLESLEVDPLVLHSDASDGGIGGVLTQLHHETGAHHPIAFFSKKFSPAELNYSVNDKESLATVACLSRWRHYLASAPFELRSDNKGVIALMQGGAPSRRQARWLDLLSEFHFTAVHVPGRLHTVADVVSRRPYTADDVPGVGVEADVVFPDTIPCACVEFRADLPAAPPVVVPASLLEHVQVAVMAEVDPAGYYCRVLTSAGDEDVPCDPDLHALVAASLELNVDDVLPSVAAASATDPWLGPVVAQAAIAGPVAAQHGFRRLYAVRGDHNGRPCVYSLPSALVAHERLCVPAACLSVFMRAHHCLPTGAHRGRSALVSTLRSLIHAKQLDKKCSRFVAACEKCLRNRPLNRRAAPLPRSIEPPLGRWTDWSLDFVTELPRTSSGFDTVLTVTDRFSKTRRFIPTVNSVDAAGTVDLLLRNVVAYHGFPVSLLSDRDARFTAAVWTGLFKRAGVKLKMSTANQATTNGSAESSNAVLEQFLRNYVNHRQSDWDRWLPFAELASNTTPHSSTSLAPCVVDTGRMLRLPTAWTDPLPPDPLPELLAQQRAIFVQVSEQLQLAIHEVARRGERAGDRHLPPFSVGDMVMVSTEFLMSAAERIRPKRKLAARFEGPFRILEVVGGAYRLELPDGVSAHDVVAAQALKPWLPPVGADEPDRPGGPIVVVDAEVVSIHRFFHRKLQFFTGWESMPQADFSWQQAGFFLAVAPGPRRLRQPLLDYLQDHPDIRARAHLDAACVLPP